MSRCPTDGEEVKVGEFNGVTQQLDLSKGQGICWQDGRGPPKDRTLQQFEHSHVNLAIYASLAATASCGIIIAAVFLAINIKYRNQRYFYSTSTVLHFCIGRIGQLLLTFIGGGREIQNT